MLENVGSVARNINRPRRPFRLLSVKITQGKAGLGNAVVDAAWITQSPYSSETERSDRCSSFVF